MFCVLCLLTALYFEDAKISENKVTLKKEYVYGPIEINDKSQVYRIKAHFSGTNSSNYISGEVLNKDKDTLYEFGKDLWQEHGYDDEGEWTESDRNRVVHLTFSEKGTYYIQLNNEDDNSNTEISISKQRGSYIVHLQVGTICFLLVLLFWVFINGTWVKEKLTVPNDKLEEMSDDDD